MLGDAGIIALLRLWTFAATYRPDGNLTGYDAEGIADAAGWRGKRDKLISALIEARFLELEDSNTGVRGMKLHDWSDHQPWVIHASERSSRAKKAAEKRWSREDGCAEHHMLNADGNAKCNAGSNAPYPIPTPIPTPNPKPDPKPKKDSKIHYAEFVTMTEEEHQKLIAAYGEPAVRRMVEILDNYKGANGKRYKSDYRAILNWVADKVTGEAGKGGQAGRHQPGSSGYDYSKLAE
jgi:hypothetical protein